jgi:Ca2+-binding EF-hand superfamily protein
MFERFDTNKNGTLEKEEWAANTMTDMSPADSNRDSRITREELAAWMAARRSSGGGGFGPGGGGPGGGFFFGGRGGDSGGRDGGREGGREGGRDGGREGGGGFSRERGRGEDFRGGGGGDGPGGGFFTRRSDDSGSGSSDGGSSGSSTSSSSSSSSSNDERATYRATTVKERLAKEKDLPSWFGTIDMNVDGQIAMAEYSTSWSDSVAREFNRFDLNGDGFITPKECLKASQGGAVRGAGSSAGGSSGSRSSTVATSATPSPSSSSSTTAASSTGTSTASTTPASGAANVASGAPIDARTLTFSVNWVKTNDRNGDGVLSKDEWESMSKNPSAADLDKDGKITPDEHARYTISR